MRRKIIIGIGTTIAIAASYNIGWRGGYEYNIVPNKSSRTSKVKIEYPGEWDMEHLNESMIEVKKGSKEWKMLEKKMKSTIVQHKGKKYRTFRVRRIQRYQDKVLWTRYCFRKQIISWENNGNENEMLLFHGSSNYKKVLKQGFDPRLANDGMFGRGTYFAENSSKSDQYVKINKGGKIKSMLVCRVALGRSYVLTYPWKFVRPPKEGDSLWVFFNERYNYHSVTGDSRKHSLRAALKYREFIIYHPDQAYPQYCIEYEVV